MADATPHAFVIMPFTDELTWVYDDVLAPLLRELGYEAVRADTTLNQQNLLADIVSGIAEADVIIADLTGLNPNVMYELGLAHGLRRPVVMLTQEISSVPFDLRSYRLNPYTDRYPDVETLKAVLKQTLEAHKSRVIRFSNPVDDFHPDTRQQAHNPNTEPESDDDSVPESVPMGLIDHEERFTELGQTTSGHLEAIGQRAERFAEEVQQITGQADATRPNDPNLNQQRRRLSTLMARAVDEFASDLQNSTPQLLEYWAELETTLDSIVRSSTITTPEDAQAVRELIETLDEFAEQLQHASDEIVTSRESIGGLRALSRELGRAVPRLERAMGSMISAIDVGAAFSNRSKRVLEQRLRDFDTESQTD